MHINKFDDPTPMSWDEYQRLGPHAGSYSLRDIGIGAAIGLGAGGAIALAVPSAALLLTIGGTVIGGAFGTLPSVVKNQEMAYQKYLGQFERTIEITNSDNNIEQTPPIPEGAHVARLQKEGQQKAAVSLKH